MAPKKSRSQSAASRTNKRSTPSSAKKKTTSTGLNARKSSPKKSGSKKSMLSRVANRSGVKKAVRTVKRSGIVQKVEDAMGKMLAGAASGAVSGALEAVLPTERTANTHGQKRQ